MKMKTGATCGRCRSGLGIIIRDDRNEIVATVVDLHARVSSLLFEIWAIRERLHLAVGLGLRKIMVESDLLEAINLITRDVV